MDYTCYAEEGSLDMLKEICKAITGKLKLKITAKPETGAMVISQTYPHEKASLHTIQQLATYCEVEIDGYPGYGCIQGNEPERAYYAAVIDAVIWNNHPVISNLSPLITVLENDISAKRKNRRKELYA